VAGTCAPATGLCTNPAAPNGTSCDDGNECTAGDACHDGICQGPSGTVPIVNATPKAIAGGDFNGDGKRDLVIASSAALGRIQVLTGDGQGGFTLPPPNTVPGPNSIAVGDWDGDGDLDLAVTSSLSTSVRILRWSGSGFVVSASIVVGSRQNRVVAGRFNADSFLDLAVAS